MITVSDSSHICLVTVLMKSPSAESSRDSLAVSTTAAMRGVGCHGEETLSKTVTTEGGPHRTLHSKIVSEV